MHPAVLIPPLVWFMQPPKAAKLPKKEKSKTQMLLAILPFLLMLRSSNVFEWTIYLMSVILAYKYVQIRLGNPSTDFIAPLSLCVGISTFYDSQYPQSYLIPLYGYFAYAAKSSDMSYANSVTDFMLVHLLFFYAKFSLFQTHQ